VSITLAEQFGFLGGNVEELDEHPLDSYAALLEDTLENHGTIAPGSDELVGVDSQLSTNLNDGIGNI